MTKEEFIDYLIDNSNINFKDKLENRREEIAKKINWNLESLFDKYNELFSPNPKVDPYKTNFTLSQLNDLIENFSKKENEEFGKKIRYGHGGGAQYLRHYIKKLKEEDKTGNTQAIEENLQKIINNFSDRRKKNVSIPTPILTGIDKDNDNHTAVKGSYSGKEEEYSNLLQNVYNIIFHGAPGTGKTFLARKIAQRIGCGENQIKMVQFHPSYDYSDFMEGLRPSNNREGKEIGFERMNGTFKEFCRKALKEGKNEEKSFLSELNSNNKGSDKTEPKPYVFIIDEINRGEIAKILGECMFSIDPEYVGNNHKIDTQYQNLIDKNDKEDPFNLGFYRPENVYIIGTMNDIDRGVESMDLAMRRRFIFIEIKAEDTQEEILNNLDEGLDKEIAKKAMNNLNQKIREIEELGEDYCIGASYFLKVKNYDPERKWTLLWDYHLNGLLKEYLRGMENNKNILKDLRKVYFNSVDKPSENASDFIESDENITHGEEFSDNDSEV